MAYSKAQGTLWRQGLMWALVFAICRAPPIQNKVNTPSHGNDKLSDCVGPPKQDHTYCYDTKRTCLHGVKLRSFDKSYENSIKLHYDKTINALMK